MSSFLLRSTNESFGSDENENSWSVPFKPELVRFNLITLPAWLHEMPTQLHGMEVLFWAFIQVRSFVCECTQLEFAIKSWGDCQSHIALRINYGSIWIEFILLKLKNENWKHYSKIIFKCVNSIVRPIFNEKVVEKCNLWDPSTVHGYTVHCWLSQKVRLRSEEHTSETPVTS